MVDHGVDGGRADPAPVLAAGRIRRCRAQPVAQHDSRHESGHEGHLTPFELAAAHAIEPVGHFQVPGRRGDADPVHHVHQRGLLAQAERRAEDELHGERLAGLDVHHHPVADLPSRFAEEVDRAGHVVAIEAVAVGLVADPGLGEDALRNLAAPRLKKRNLPLGRQPVGRHPRVVEVALRVVVEAVHKDAVRGAELREQPKGLAHPDVLELRHVEVPHDRRPQPPRPREFQKLALEVAIVHGGKVVACHPVLGDGLGADVDDIALLRLQHHRLVLEVVDLEAVEVVAALVHGEVGTPIVLHPLVGDPAAEHVLADAVGTAA